MFYLKGGIHITGGSTETFLYNIRELRCKQNNMRNQISRIWNNISFLKMWYHHNLCLISLVRNILEGWDVSHIKGDILRHVSSSNQFLYNTREPKYKQNNRGHQISEFLLLDIPYLFTSNSAPWYPTKIFLQAPAHRAGPANKWILCLLLCVLCRLIDRKYHQHWGWGQWAPRRQKIVKLIHLNDNICCSRKTRKIIKVWAELCHTRT